MTYVMEKAVINYICILYNSIFLFITQNSDLYMKVSMK